MYKKITLTEIKQEAKDLKKLKTNLKHTKVLNKIAQKYGYEKFEILKAKFDKQSYIKVDIDIIEPISFFDKKISEEIFNPLSTEGEGAYIDVFNAPTPDIEFTEDMVKTTLTNFGTKTTLNMVKAALSNFGTKITLKITPLEKLSKKN